MAGQLKTVSGKTGRSPGTNRHGKGNRAASEPQYPVRRHVWKHQGKHVVPSISEPGDGKRVGGKYAGSHGT